MQIRELRMARVCVSPRVAAEEAADLFQHLWARTRCAGETAVELGAVEVERLADRRVRRLVGDPHRALNAGDVVELTVEAVGKMRVGRGLLYHCTGVAWVTERLSHEADAHRGTIMSPDRALSRAVVQGAAAIRDLQAGNRRRDIGAA